MSDATKTPEKPPMTWRGKLTGFGAVILLVAAIVGGVAKGSPAAKYIGILGLACLGVAAVGAAVAAVAARGRSQEGSQVSK